MSNGGDHLDVHTQNIGEIKSFLDTLTSLLEVFEVVDDFATEDRLGIIHRHLLLRKPAFAVKRALDIMTHNSNTNYNFGRDIINNNWVINFVSQNETDRVASNQDVMKKIKKAIGDRFVPSAVDDTQPKDAGCLVGTRKAVLSKFVAWVKDDPMRIFWLAGLAGTGKTSIAVTLCRLLQAQPDSEVLLAGAFFCSRTVNDDARTDVRRIIPTLAASLAEKSPRFAAALAEELKTNSRAAFKSVDDQINALLQRPLAALASSNHTVAFIIDALDECADEGEVKKFLFALPSLTCDAKVKFIITSRPETHISATPIANSNINSIMRLHTIDKTEVTDDIRLYVKDAFSQQPLDEPWYAERDVEALSARADGLFIFASTAIKYVLDTGSPNARQKRLQNILTVANSVAAVGPLDAMYEFVMTRASSSRAVDPDELEATQQVLVCMLTARMPLSVTALADLLGRRPVDLHESLRRIHPVVNVPERPDHPGLRTIHASFGDYLLNRAQRNIRVSASLGHDLLARGCLQRMAWVDLCFNVSRSRSSYNGYLEEYEEEEDDDYVKQNDEDTRKAEEGKTPSKKRHSIAPSLVYACLHWAHHMDAASERSAFDCDIEQIFWPKFLFWMEVLSVLQKVNLASGLLRIAGSAVNQTRVSQLIHDANSFVASSREAIERSAPHIYLSALPFAAKDSLVFTTFAPLCTGMISVETVGIDRHGGGLVMILIGHQGPVYSVAYSYDGRFLASGSRDGTAQIWDTRTGEETTAPLRSGDGPVWSVAYSPDGQYLVTGTDSGIVCVWRVLTDQNAPQRLEGHADSVRIVKFSPDGSILASASRDNTVRLWSIGTGQGLALLDHTDMVRTIIFSLDSETVITSTYDSTTQLWRRRSGFVAEGWNKPYVNILSVSPYHTVVASSTNDLEIQLWDVESNRKVSILRGNTSTIHSIQFSPNGQLLVSAAEDSSVRLWSVRNDAGIAFSVRFDGHTGPAYSVAFSTDGQYIASGSADFSIRIWESRNNKSASTTLSAHDSDVNSVEVSPDGTFFVSGSHDFSIRVWDVMTGNPRLPPLLWHTVPVHSVTISSDGHLIASGDENGVIRLWDAHSGELLSEPLRGHRAAVLVVVFSSEVQWLASGSSDHAVCVWEAALGQRLPIGPLRCNGSVQKVAFSPNGQLIAAGDETGRIYLWHSHTGLPACDPWRADDERISAISFSADGTQIVSSGQNPRVCVWNVRTRQLVLNLKGHTDSANSVACSPDGRFIGSGSKDDSIRLWDRATGAPVVAVYGHSKPVLSTAFTPDGRFIVSGSYDETIRIWNIEMARSLPSAKAEDIVAALASTGLDDGWLLGPAGELLLWVPPDYRAHLCLPHSILISKRRVTINANADALHVGEDWTSCWREEQPFRLFDVV